MMLCPGTLAFLLLLQNSGIVVDSQLTVSTEAVLVAKSLRKCVQVVKKKLENNPGNHTSLSIFLIHPHSSVDQRKGNVHFEDVVKRLADDEIISQVVQMTHNNSQQQILQQDWPATALNIFADNLNTIEVFLNNQRFSRMCSSMKNIKLITTDTSVEEKALQTTLRSIYEQLQSRGSILHLTSNKNQPCEVNAVFRSFGTLEVKNIDISNDQHSKYASGFDELAEKNLHQLHGKKLRTTHMPQELVRQVQGSRRRDRVRRLRVQTR